MNAYLFVCVQVCRSEAHIWVSFSIVFTLFLRQSLSLNLELPRPAGTANSLPVAAAQCRDGGHVLSNRAFGLGAGI